MKLRYFSAAGDPNFACKCGCGLGFDDMSPSFLSGLDDARDFAGVPFVINSGIRCPEYNARVSSTGADGPHTTGRAADIRVRNSRERRAILEALFEMGFHRIGIAGSFIHVDDSPEHTL